MNGRAFRITPQTLYSDEYFSCDTVLEKTKTSHKSPPLRWVFQSLKYPYYWITALKICISVLLEINYSIFMQYYIIIVP